MSGLPLNGTGALLVTEDAASPVAMVAGFCRRLSDGAVCVTTDATGATMQAGFLRSPSRKLVYGNAALAFERNGFGRVANGGLAVTTTDPANEPQHGLKFDATGRLYVSVVDFVLDSFTDADAVSLAAHVGEVGAIWTPHPISTQIMQMFQGRVRGTASSALLMASGIPPTANYELSADVTVIADNNSSSVGLIGRVDPAVDTKYTLRYTSSNDSWELSKAVAGAGTSFVVFPGAPLLSGTHRMALRMFNDQITGLLDGVVVAGPITDAAIPAAGRAGIYSAGVGGDAVGFHLDNYRATAL